MPLFDKLLVANRGEIACRIMRTAKRLNIKTVAVFSEPDSKSPHVMMADEAVCVGGASSASSYLRADAILEAVRQTGANAVHPGYGFLSENADFSKAVEDAGAAFVGPAEFAIRAMGDKIESKKLAAAAGVSTIPGVLGVLQSAEEAVKVANDVGYPVMLKASAGGGGKGMRIAYNDAEAASGYALSMAEALASFGDDRVFIERYVEQPRHVEIQLIADSFGNCVYLSPRDCSIQRRNQKVIEEAPAPHLSDETVRAMGEEAVALAKAVGYRSAGTVEYLVDAQQRHYFLEMNTRLQVEHPVTEEVTGVDLVELMIRVASGEKLPITQADVTTKGWSFECRVYAEDPLRNFLPSVGTLTTYRPPTTEVCAPAAAAAALASGGADAAALAADCHLGIVRVDDGIVEGGEISVNYDPMVAKLITRAPTREAARLVMLEALDRYAIRGAGLRHNINFLRTLMDHPRFAAGQLTTAFIPEEFPDGYTGHALNGGELHDVLSCAAALQFAHERRRTHTSTIGGAFGAGSGMLRVGLGGVEHDVHVAVANSAHARETILPPGAVVHVTAAPVNPPDESPLEPWTRTMRLDTSGLGPEGVLEARFLAPADAHDSIGRPLAVQVVERLPLGWALTAFGTTHDVHTRRAAFEELSNHMLPPPRSALDGALLSPMPGTLVAVHVTPGDHVHIGKELVVIEAMKMQNVLTATRDGIVSQVLAEAGATLKADEPIITFEVPEAEGDAAAAAA